MLLLYLCLTLALGIGQSLPPPGSPPGMHQPPSGLVGTLIWFLHWPWLWSGWEFPRAWPRWVISTPLPHTEEEISQTLPGAAGPLPSPPPDSSHRGLDGSTCTASTRSRRPAPPRASWLCRACPSLCQVMLGAGVPRASQRSSKGKPGVSDSSAGPESSMWGGSAKHPTLGQLWGLCPEHWEPGFSACPPSKR